MWLSADILNSMDSWEEGFKKGERVERWSVKFLELPKLVQGILSTVLIVNMKVPLVIQSTQNSHKMCDYLK